MGILLALVLAQASAPPAAAPPQTRYVGWSEIDKHWGEDLLVGDVLGMPGLAENTETPTLGGVSLLFHLDVTESLPVPSSSGVAEDLQLGIRAHLGTTASAFMRLFIDVTGGFTNWAVSGGSLSWIASLGLGDEIAFSRSALELSTPAAGTPPNGFKPPPTGFIEIVASPLGLPAGAPTGAFIFGAHSPVGLGVSAYVGFHIPD